MPPFLACVLPSPSLQGFLTPVQSSEGTKPAQQLALGYFSLPLCLNRAVWSGHPTGKMGLSRTKATLLRLFLKKVGSLEEAEGLCRVL